MDAACPLRVLHLTRLCETKFLLRLSGPRDNCKERFCRVYSLPLHKGKPVVRRGRKASGPSAHTFSDVVGRRIAGLPARASDELASSLLVSAFAAAVFSSVSMKSCMRLRRTACAYKTKNWEQRKLTRANPSKGGDAKPPVYRTIVLRQRGYQSSRIGEASSVLASIAAIPFLRPEFSARGRSVIARERFQGASDE